MAQPTEAAAAGRESDALGDPHARAPGADDAKVSPPPAGEESSAISSAVEENEGDASDSHPRGPSPVPVSESECADGSTESARDPAEATDAMDADQLTCKACRDPAAGDVCVCGSCGIAVHAACYSGVAQRSPLQPHSAGSGKRSHKRRKIQRDAVTAADEADDSAEWTCDYCAHEVAAASELTCVFCKQPSGDLVMKFVDTSAWGAQYASSSTNSKSFAHLLCSRWDPHATQQQLQQQQLEAARAEKQENPEGEQEQPLPQQTRNHRRQEDGKSADAAAAEEEEVTGSSATPAPADPEPPAAASEAPLDVQEPSAALRLSGLCCFCESANGVRIQCQRLDCGLFFHAMCAHQRSGRLETRVSPQSPSLVEYHAYCSRHRDCADNAGALIEKMLSKPVNSLTGRDAVLRLVTVKRRLEANAFATIHAFFGAVVTVLTDLCKKGLKTSKTDPPTHSVKHLQALQFFLDHVPQLQVVYRAPFPRQLVLGDSSEQLYALLQKTFNPPRFLGKYAGPVSQLHACQVCVGPFHERQHLFYCSNPTTPHLQHWKCTKRRSTSREREKIAASLAAASAGGSSSSTTTTTKKKLTSISLVVSGQLSDVKLPKGLPGVSDGLVCAICRCDVDASGVIASRKEGKRADFEKKSSDFVLGGCYVNAGDLPKVSIIATMALPAAPGSKLDTKQAAAAAAVTTKAAASDRNRSKRGGAEQGALRPVAAGGVAAPQDAPSAASAAAPVVHLGPPKLDRIQVQRTAKWLAYVAQIIRLAGAMAKLSAEAAAGGAAAKVSEKPTVNGTSEGDMKATPAPTVTETVDQAPALAQSTSPAAPAIPALAASAAPLTTAPSAAAAELPPPASTVSLASETVETPQPPPAQADREAELAQLAKTIDACFSEAIAIVRPFDADAYVLSRLETARRYYNARSGPAVGVLRMLAQEYTRIVFTKHSRAVEKAANEKRKRLEQEAQEQRELARKRQEREAEEALKTQLQAMRQKKRKLVKMG